MVISINRIVKVTFVCMIFAMLFVGCSATQMDGNEIDYQQAMKEAYENLYANDGCKAEDLTVNYLGYFEGCHVGYIGGFHTHTTAMENEIIGKHEFHFTSSARPMVYNNGVLKQLKDAYEAGWLSDEALAQLYEAHENQ